MTTQEEYRKREAEEQRQQKFRTAVRDFLDMDTPPENPAPMSAEKREEIRSWIVNTLETLLDVPDSQLHGLHQRFLQPVGESGHATDGQFLLLSVKHAPALIPKHVRKEGDIFS